MHPKYKTFKKLIQKMDELALQNHNLSQYAIICRNWDEIFNSDNSYDKMIEKGTPEDIAELYLKKLGNHEKVWVAYVIGLITFSQPDLKSELYNDL